MTHRCVGSLEIQEEGAGQAESSKMPNMPKGARFFGSRGPKPLSNCRKGNTLNMAAEGSWLQDLMTTIYCTGDHVL